MDLTKTVAFNPDAQIGRHLLEMATLHFQKAAEQLDESEISGLATVALQVEQAIGEFNELEKSKANDNPRAVRGYGRHGCS